MAPTTIGDRYAACRVPIYGRYWGVAVSPTDVGIFCIQTHRAIRDNFGP